MFSKITTALKGSRKAKAEETLAPDSALAVAPFPAKRRFHTGRTIAFSIDSQYLSMAAASNFAGRSRVVSLKKLPLSQDFSPAEREAFLKNAIRDFHASYSRGGTEVILSVSGQDTAYRSFTLPPLSKRDLNDAVQFEVSRQVPFPIADCIYDYRLLSKISNEETERYKLGLWAATRHFVEEQLALFSSLGIQVTGIHHSHDAVGHLLHSVPDYKEKDEFTLLRLNRSQVEIAFYRGMRLELLHQVPLDTLFMFGWSEYVDVETIASGMAQEITTAMDFFSGQFSRSSGNKIYAYGDLSGMDQLIEQLELKTGLDIRHFPTGQLTFLKGQDPFFANNMRESLPVVASCFCSYQLANLLPPERKSAILLRQQNRLSALGLIAAAVAVTLLTLHTEGELQTNQIKLESLRQQMNLATSSSAYTSYNLLQSQIASNKTYFNQIKETGGGVALNLKALSLITPRGVQLASYEYEPKLEPENVLVQGVVHAKDLPPELILADYVKSFPTTGFYDQVRLVQYVKRKTDDGFDLQFSLAMKGPK